MSNSLDPDNYMPEIWIQIRPDILSGLICVQLDCLQKVLTGKKFSVFHDI